MTDCDCTRIWPTPCYSTEPADCAVRWHGQVLHVTSECLYALLDRDDCERPRAGEQLELGGDNGS